MTHKILRACKVVFVSILLFMICDGLSEAASQSRMRITTGSGVRVRTGPQVAAEEVTRLPIGSVVEELEGFPHTEKIAGVEDRWYRVALPDGKQGWLFGGFTTVFDPAKAAENYLQIANNRLKVEQPTFNDAVDLVNFLTRVIPPLTSTEAAANLELARLLAISKAASAIPIEKQEEPLYQTWIKAQGDQIVYSEPAAQWFVDSDLFWKLQQKYKALPVADKIAWEAANNSLPGECEGFLDCDLYAYIRTLGRYLDLYPRGAHAEEALKNLGEFLSEVIKSNGTYSVGEKADLTKALAELRATVGKSSSAKKAAVLKQLDQVGSQYR
ncbi:MAG TPA: SH3 domain-containing protein [Blastocatellia bacterium]|nr:SH3 domain-containing protein [Blastocatellia bacterium]